MQQWQSTTLLSDTGSSDSGDDMDATTSAKGAQATSRPQGTPRKLPDALAKAVSKLPSAGHCESKGSKGGEETVRVVARFRPLSKQELAKQGEKEIVDYGNDGRSCAIVAENGNEVEFNYSQVLQPEATQSDVYEAVGRPVVESVLKGINGAIMAYGQTGSGKTHTMLGPNGAEALLSGNFDGESLGIVPQALLELQQAALVSEGAVTLRVSYVEIYQERVIDLLGLAPPGENEKHVVETIRQDTKNGLWLPDVVEFPVRTAKEAMEILQRGSRRRTCASTQMNRDSSRSHAIFIVTVTNCTSADRHKFAQLYLVDLAGSERINKTRVEGQQLAEAKLINLSLHALGQVVWSLSQKSKHVPYRDSKLTRLLQNCLGGSSRTAIVINVSPHESNVGETVSSLRFGDRASSIRNQAKMNVVLNAAELKKLLKKAREELSDIMDVCRRLERENAALREGSPGDRFGHVVPAKPERRASPPAAFSPEPGTAEGDRPMSDSDRELSISAKCLARDHVSDFSPGGQHSDAGLLQLVARQLFVRGLLPSLLCPLTHEVMHDPVFAADGYTYNRGAIEQHMARAKGQPLFSPMSGRILVSKQLTPNMVLRQQVRHHLADLPLPKTKVSTFARVGMFQLELILTCLDARSLARSFTVNANFFAVGSQPRLWSPLLLADFGVGDGHSRPRERYCELKRCGKKNENKSKKEDAYSHGLHLYAPPNRRLRPQGRQKSSKPRRNNSVPKKCKQ
jgi:hypothetical protein